MTLLEKKLKEMAPKNTVVISETIEQKLGKLSPPLANCIYEKLDQYIPTLSFEEAKCECEEELARSHLLEKIGITEQLDHEKTEQAIINLLLVFKDRISDVEHELEQLRTLRQKLTTETPTEKEEDPLLAKKEELIDKEQQFLDILIQKAKRGEKM